jgi:hypothetical protein
MNWGDLFWLIFGTICVIAWTLVRIFGKPHDSSWWSDDE